VSCSGCLRMFLFRVDTKKLASLFASNQFLGLLDIFSGGTLVQFSILALGLNPYINASIILQLLTIVFRNLKSFQKKGNNGREKIIRTTRFITVPLAAVQSVGMFCNYLKIRVLSGRLHHWALMCNCGQQ